MPNVRRAFATSSALLWLVLMVQLTVCLQQVALRALMPCVDVPEVVTKVPNVDAPEEHHVDF